MTRALESPELLDCGEKVVGIVTPNYYVGLPVVVADFLRKASFRNAGYLFMILTSGHDFGAAISSAQNPANQLQNV